MKRRQPDLVNSLPLVSVVAEFSDFGFNPLLCLPQWSSYLNSLHIKVVRVDPLPHPPPPTPDTHHPFTSSVQLRVAILRALEDKNQILQLHVKAQIYDWTHITHCHCWSHTGKSCGVIESKSTKAASGHTGNSQSLQFLNQVTTPSTTSAIQVKSR